MSSPPDNDGCGYGRPPEHTRWKKGQCGNSKPRKSPGPKGTVEMIDRLFLKPVEIAVNGVTKNVTTLEAILLQLWLKEMSGNRPALRVRLKYEEFARQNSEPSLEVVFLDSEYARAVAAGPSTRSRDHE
jgi:Family of unknown function (DUF5681)